GMLRTITAPPAIADAAGRQYMFANWSDGGAESHEISFPEGASTLTANYNLNDSPNAPGNLFANPSLEQPGAGGLEPGGWLISGWGDVHSTFAFTGVGKAGSQGCSIVASGSAKYSASFCHPVEVAITPGATYRYADQYRSSVPTGVFALFINDSGMYDFV